MQPFDVDPETLSRAQFDALLTQLQHEGWFTSAPARRDRAVRGCLLHIQAAVRRGDTDEAIYRVNRLAAYASLNTPHILSQLYPQSAAELAPVLTRALERNLMPSLVPLALGDIVGAWFNPLKQSVHIFVRPGATQYLFERDTRLFDDLETSLSCHAGRPLRMEIHSAQ